MDDVPLENAYLEFVSQGVRPAYGKTDSDGEYVLEYSTTQKGAVPGDYTVKIHTGAQAYISIEGDPVPAVPETVPRKYNNATTLTFTVVDGESNEANFELDSEGKIDPTPEDDDN